MGTWACSYAPTTPATLWEVVKAICKQTVRLWEPGQQLCLRKANEKLLLDVS